MAKATQKTPINIEEQAALLTDDQLLAMSEDDYMNDLQLEFFKLRLKNLEKEILDNANATTDNLRETQFVPDPADRATIEEEHALELRTRDRERKLLKKVQQSLVSIDDGDYGWCEETGDPIGLPRLLARPTANLSLEAQERREKRQKQFGDWSISLVFLNKTHTRLIQRAVSICPSHSIDTGFFINNLFDLILLRPWKTY